MRHQIWLAAAAALSLGGCNADRIGNSELKVSVEKLNPVILENEHCDIVYKITNSTNNIVDHDSIRMLAVDAGGNTVSSVLINVVNARPGKSVSGTDALMNVSCDEIAGFTSLSADFSGIKPDENSKYPIATRR